MSDLADWISAGANVAAAIGTVGALWVGAVTLRRQVNDQHRAQASAITVGSEVEVRPLQESKLLFFITNNSPLPIYRVGLYGSMDEESDGTAKADVLPPTKTIGFYSPIREERKVLAEFSDSAGNRWMRNESGQLIEWPENNWWRRHKMKMRWWWRKKLNPNWLQKELAKTKASRQDE